ncbi:Efflux pump radE [Lachnellula arida]|uniref:Efflux pump radE n=1 Tax=Lachnellula arida TaxID=1316785 RepID=A0A8T9BQ80_9HELO|nr:Efflux pump radE [Lachnellula arida]
MSTSLDPESILPTVAQEKMISDIPVESAVASFVSNNETLPSVVVDWDGQHDPENSINWPSRGKGGIITLVSALTFLGAMASTIFAPGVPFLMKDFNSNNNQLASFTVSVYVVGFCIGPLILSPLSEHYGLLPYITDRTLFRFLQGLAGCLPITLGGGTIADMYPPERRGTAMAIWTLGPLLGPVIGPVIGGFLAESVGWRWIFWLVTIITAVLSIATFIFLRETYVPTLLERKAESIRKLSQNPTRIRCKYDRGQTGNELLIAAIVRPSKLLTRSPIVFILAIYVGLVYAYMYLLYTTFTPVFTSQYGFTTGTAGLSFLGLGIGFVLGQVLVGIFADRYLRAKAKQSTDGKTQPEHRLPPLAVGAFFIPVGLIWYGWSTHYRAPWIVPILGIGFVGIGCVCAFLSSQMYLVDSFGIYAASATATNTVVRSLFGATVPLAGSSLYGKLGYGWGNTILAFVALAFCPVPFLLMKYGKKIRMDTRFQPKL